MNPEELELLRQALSESGVRPQADIDADARRTSAETNAAVSGGVQVPPPATSTPTAADVGAGDWPDPYAGREAEERATQALGYTRYSPELRASIGPGGAVASETPTPPPQERESVARAPDVTPPDDLQQRLAAQLGDPRRRAETVSASPIAKPTMSATPAPSSQRWDHTGADLADVLTSPIRGLGNALLAASHRPIPGYQSLGQQSRQREAAARAMDLADAQSGARERVAALANSTARDRLALDRERLAGEQEDRDLARQLSERMQSGRLEVSQQRADIYRALLRARLGDAEFQRQSQDPASEVSQRARERIRTIIAAGPPALRDRVAQQWGQIDDLSDYDIQRVERALPTMSRDLTGRGGRTQRTGGATIPGTALETPPPGWQGTEEQWSALPRRERMRAVASLGTRSTRGGAGGTEEAPEVIPGSGIRFGGDVDDTTIRQVRSGLAEARSHSAALGSIDSIARRYGARATVDPRIEAELVAPTQAMMAMVATLRNTGVINPGEAPTIEAAIPNPRNLRQMTLGEVQGRVRSFRTLLQQRVRANLAVQGVSDGDADRVVQWLTSGGELRPPSGSGGRDEQQAPTSVRLPSGRVFRDLTPDQAQRLLRVQGAEAL